MPQPLQISVLLTFGGPLSPIDGGFQRFHEACSRIHPLEKMFSEVSYLRLVPAGRSLPRGFCRGVRARSFICEIAG